MPTSGGKRDTRADKAAERDSRVRRPISYKIFGITGLLLMLMALVTLISSINLNRVDRQMTLLSDYYIPVDQILGDIRYHHLLQGLLLERALAANAPLTSLQQIRRTVQSSAGELGDCNYETYSAASKKLRESVKDPVDQALLGFELNRYCGDRKTMLAIALVDKALTLPYVLDDPTLVREFTQLQAEMQRIPEARATMLASIDKFAAQSQTADAQAVEILKEQMETDRRAVGRASSTVSRLLHNITRDAAAKASRVERSTTLFNWGITLCAAILGIMFASLITRNVIRPVRALLKGAKSVERGDLNISIQVKSSDEIEQLAQTFNYMVTGLREKESIKETFGKYIDPRIVKDLLDEHSFSEVGNKRFATVFFSDIEGFTPICEQLSADAVVKLLNSYFTHMSKPIRERGGIIDKYIGDAIMAFWGPPFTGEREHALLACQAALDQIARLAEFRASLPDIIGLRKGIPAFNIRIGVCTGEVTAGSVGSEAAKSYTVIGDTVNLASRLEAANKTFGTYLLISEATRDLAGDAIETRDLDRIRVPGKVESVRVFELLGRAGEVNAKVLKLRDRFESGLRCYRERDWDGAEGHFAGCAELDPDDRPTRFFLGLVTRFRAHPPAEDWDGVLELTK
ncbi:MAG TPA: adenylate/guanylate cyclase domain-containing protein [Thiobacillaceae bacterium]|nr:adenylate/guanylate cyclase domain-containing protein [Thiobacillaceae bacterium]